MPKLQPLELCFDFVLGEEGGYVNDPKDSGGATKYGVSLNNNRDFIGDKNGDGKIDAEDVKLLTVADAQELFRQKYWLPCHCDELPPAIALALVDYAYHSGVRQAVLDAQRSCVGFGLAQDGIIGPKTISALRVVDRTQFLPEFLARRIHFQGKLAGWSAYALGWSRRNTRLLQRALALDLWQF